jgi:adenylate cyclase, class 2
MAIEIEAKMAVPDLEAVRAALRARGAERVGRTDETNVFLDTKGRSLLAADEGLRLRTNRDAETGRETHVITHKGPQQAGAFKSREETELEVPDAAAAFRLLEKLGLRRTLSFEKRRESWKLGGCKVELDEVPYLGSYVEVEGPAEAEVAKVRESLGLADRPAIKTSYIAMLMAYLKERGQSPSEVTFAQANRG